MFNPKDIRISDYTYELPNERIARYPAEQRDLSKLLVFDGTRIMDDTFRNITSHIPAGSLVISNNSRVIPARLFFRKETGALIEVFCIEPVKPVDYQESFSSRGSCTWKCIVGNLKKWKDGVLCIDFVLNKKTISFLAEIEQRGINEQIIRFSWNDDALSFATVIESLGKLPIPPYLERDTEESDLLHYQTVYSKMKGSVAAPTAGLHFTNEVIESIRDKSCVFDELTLHVGAGTFKPVKSETLGGHDMHREHFSVTRNTIEQILSHLGNIVAVGTTSTRALESLYLIGAGLDNCHKNDIVSLNVGQWQAYESRHEILSQKAFENVLNYMNLNGLSSIQCSTSIIIVPGYRFRVVSRLVTNFHQPQSTLMLLVAAFVGERWKDIYQHALENGYRFLSYGDSSCLMRAT